MGEDKVRELKAWLQQEEEILYAAKAKFIKKEAEIARQMKKACPNVWAIRSKSDQLFARHRNPDTVAIYSTKDRAEAQLLQHQQYPDISNKYEVVVLTDDETIGMIGSYSFLCINDTFYEY